MRRVRRASKSFAHGLVRPASASSVEQVSTTGFAHVSRDAQHEPQRIVVESAADLGVSGARQRLVLVIGAAVALLRGGEVNEALANLVREPRPALSAGDAQKRLDADEL